MTRLALLAASLLALASCEAAPVAEPVPVAQPVPAPPPPRPEPPPPPPPEPPGPSAESEALAAYYRRLQADLLSRGLLRGDGGGTDTPFTDTMLARNFVAIALFDEYGAGGRPAESRLRRWDGPVRMQVEVGASVPGPQAARDRAAIAAYAARLTRLTGVPVSQVAEGGNFHVAILNEDEREGFEGRLRELVPGIAESSVRSFLNLPRSTLCLVIAFGDGSGGYGQAVALIRAEHPDLLRTSCIHEELAQGMGLANDSPQARPSVFNDDEEFGLLTRHDEMLLRMLYDERMRVGMSLEEAEPVAREIAREMVGGSA